MKKNKILINACLCGFLTLSLLGCEKALNLKPLNEETAEVAFSTPLGYKQSLAKVYGSFATTGNSGPTGFPDVNGLVEGDNGDFLRTFWKSQELSTDEAVIAWGDPGIQDFHNMNWTPNNPYLRGLYSKAIFQITLVNEYLKQSTDAKLSSRGISGVDADNIRKYRAEVRFIRAFQYWVLMDVFGNPPFITEADPIGAFLPQQIKRKDLFTYVESELKAIESELPAAKTNEYGRADKAAAQALLARAYLNAEVYTGTPKYTEAVTYSKKVIDAGYTLEGNYKHISLRDNHKCTNEFIFTINYDGLKTQGFGGTTFFVHASIGGDMNAGDYGVGAAWGGLRTTKNLVNKFPDATGTLDKRAQFYTAGQSLDVTSLTQFKSGYAITKYTNLDRAGVAGPDATFVDNDFPVFRLAEMYLIYSEAILRGGTGGDAALSLTNINKIKTRAFGNTGGNITTTDLTLPFLLDERARELYWEGHRRTDLVRYNQFVEGTYLWPWKGGSPSGNAVSSHLKLYPIPSADLNANNKLDQNQGYPR